MLKTMLTAAAALLTVSCGGTTLPFTNPTSTSCTYTLSGGVSATGTCIVEVAANGGSANTTGVVVNGTTSTPAGITFSAGASWTGTSVSATTYNTSNSLTLGAAVLQGQTTAFAANYQSSNTGVATGSCSLAISSAGSETTVSTGGVWSGTHGTFDATLVPTSNSSGTGTVTVHVVF